MGQLLKNTTLAYEISDRQILIIAKTESQQNQAKSITATGVVIDETGRTPNRG